MNFTSNSIYQRSKTKKHNIHCFETNLNLLASTSEHRPQMLDPEKVNIMKEWTKEKPVYPSKPRKKRKPPLNTQIVEEENPIHYPNFIPTNKAFEKSDHINLIIDDQWLKYISLLVIWWNFM